MTNCQVASSSHAVSGSSGGSAEEGSARRRVRAIAQWLQRTVGAASARGGYASTALRKTASSAGSGGVRDRRPGSSASAPRTRTAASARSPASPSVPAGGTT
ncbi:hypothetical protein GCM10010478_62160 [Streptomyces erythrogriseus]|uniref:Uncharacterized protein n=1 Tax=Streptomyces erythrogriseus TaxID=284027 RepID=A0ABP6JX63_9ACTN